MSKELLLKRRADLEQALHQSAAQHNGLLGAKNELDYLIHQVEQDELNEKNKVSEDEEPQDEVDKLGEVA
jgi:hypothetical protein